MCPEPRRSMLGTIGDARMSHQDDTPLQQAFVMTYESVRETSPSTYAKCATASITTTAAREPFPTPMLWPVLIGTST